MDNYGVIFLFYFTIFFIFFFDLYLLFVLDLIYEFRMVYWFFGFLDINGILYLLSEYICVFCFY